MNSYHNTNNESGEVLQKSEKVANSQEELISSLFISFPDKDFTPDEVKDELKILAPITSVRRAITNLTNRNILYKTSSQRLGKYNKMTSTWKISSLKPL